MELRCALLGEGVVFPVDIDERKCVGSLKDSIKLKRASRIKCDAFDLQLYLAKRGGKWITEAEVQGLISIDGLEHLKYTGSNLEDVGLSDTETRLQSGPVALGMREVHVVAVVPESTSERVSDHLMPAIDEGWSPTWLGKFDSTQIEAHDLPHISELFDFIGGDLPVKIGVHERLRSLWMAQPNPSSPALLSKLLIADNAAPCINLCNKMVIPVVDPIQPGDSQTSFISFWDNLISHVLDVVTVSGTSNRELNSMALAGSNRPDYLLIVAAGF